MGKRDTEYKKIEEIVKDSILKSSINAIAIANLEGKITYVNDSFIKMWGYDDEKEIIGESTVKLWYTKEKAEQIIEILRDKKGWIGELVALKKDGSTFYVEVSANMVKDENGNSVCMVTSFIDITERKKIEEEKDKLLKAVEVSKEAINIASADGKIIYTNSAMNELFGYKKGELIGKFASILNVGSTPGLAMIKIMNTIKKQGFWEGEIHNKRKDRSEFVSYGAINAVKDNKGNILSYISTMHDITERKEVEKIKSELIRNVSHTLKTPVSAAEMAFDMLQRATERKDSQTIKKAERMLFNNLRTIRKDIDNILNVYFISEEKIKGTKYVSLKKIIDRIIKYTAYSADQKKIKLIVDIPKSANRVWGNEKDIETLLGNIMDNAVKFTERGKITLTSRVKDKWIEIKVKDTGVGVIEKDSNKLFEKFYKRRLSFSGVGLGLSICKEIVKKHNGTIKIMSKGEGKGTIVIVKLPKGGDKNA